LYPLTTNDLTDARHWHVVNARLIVRGWHIDHPEPVASGLQPRDGKVTFLGGLELEIGVDILRAVRAWNATGHDLLRRNGTTYIAQPDLPLYDQMKIDYASRL
jgi:hypothetical protein